MDGTGGSRAARRGGHVAKVARNQLESQLGHSVVTSLNAKDYFNSLEQNSQRHIEDNNGENIEESQ